MNTRATQLFRNAGKILVFIFGICVFSIVHAQALKVGSINQRLVRESAPMKALEAKLESEFGKRSLELRDLQMRLRSMAEKLDKDVQVLSESDRIRRERELREAEIGFQQKQRAYHEDLNQRRNEEMAVVIEKIDRAIKKLAEAEQYDLIIQEPVYINPKLDITDKVLKAVK